jgi:hypothetical protein
MLPLYEKIICDCEKDFGGLFCEIPLVKKDWFTDMSNKLYQNNMRSISLNIIHHKNFKIFKGILEKEHDAEATRFEEDNEINIYRMNLKTSKNSIKSENEKFYGIANEETKILDKQELNFVENKNFQRRKNLRKYEMLQYAFG